MLERLKEAKREERRKRSSAMGAGSGLTDQTSGYSTIVTNDKTMCPIQLRVKKV
jgi:hypothetical protein